MLRIVITHEIKRVSSNRLAYYHLAPTYRPNNRTINSLLQSKNYIMECQDDLLQAPPLTTPTVAAPATTTTTTTPAANNHPKGGKKPKKKERTGRRNREICDVFGESAMTNVYNISHNVQDFLNYRGFSWSGHKK